ncbi:MAG: UDP-N-acetylmuramoyl-L-alanine--D-glutamate ligase, partial [Patescibacteria group bacterium]
GAQVLVTDLKSSAELKPSLQKLQKYKNIKYVLGKHRLKDFQNCDFVLKGQGVALDSPYVAHARNKGIPIEMDESLFTKLAPKVKIIGVTGTRGKSTTTLLIYEILKQAFNNPSSTFGIKKPKVFLGGNIKGTAALPLLKEMKDGDMVVFELSSWQLQGFGEAKISPHISVFTNFMPDHMNYYQNSLKQYFGDKSYIYKFQKKKDVLILGPSMKNSIKGAKGKIIKTSLKNLPKSWHIELKGRHNLENIVCAIEVGRLFKIKDTIIKKVVKNFKAIEGRLELAKNIKNVDIYNDTNSTTPEATIAALNSFDKKVILIMGGMDKGLDTRKLEAMLPKKTKKIFMIPGSGGEKIKST